MGECGAHRRDGAHVIKRLTRQHPAGARFVTAMSATGPAGMRAYVDALRAGGVRLADDLRIVDSEPLTIRHRWVPGPTLLHAAGHTAPAVVAAAATEVTCWVRSLDGADARLDTNLANFCLTGGRPVLVDVLPPLIPSLRPEPVNLFDEMFTALSFDTPVLLDAFLGYALRACLRAPNRASARALLPVVEEVAGDTTTAGFPATWFRARLHLATRAVRGEIPVDSVHDFFSLTSVLGFRQATEHGRRQRIDIVARRIREWS